MSTLDTVNTDIEANVSGGGDNAELRRHRRRQRRRRRRRRPSIAGSSETTTDGSFRFSDSDSDQSWHSVAGGGSYRYEECGSSMRRAEGNLVKKRGTCELPDDDEEIDLECGELELKVHNSNKKEEKSCRICHLSLLKCGGIGDDDQLLEPSGGMAIELGCSCKGDLAAAHKQCAETWFKIKGNTICEICGATAINIIGGQASEASNATITTIRAPSAPVVLSETRRFWHGRRVMNFLLACMIFAFVISWLFHFKIFP
ncbi:uncharacterized protein LOC132052884 [Lycium ferocissimum]|uniref:uncharacterized protein LOC132052884 n=1 Tax=Lycium ferocissimum TaxID=112874 RepID=UPI002815849D|nr:uncharacterized protein LOC132052884 [Lycium ferocissimum]